MTQKKITDEQARQALAQKLSPGELAALYGVSRSTAERAYYRVNGTRSGPGRPSRTAEDTPLYARIRLLMSEGMIMTWIAEDVGVSVKHLRAKFKPGINETWQNEVWPAIKKNEELLRLHRELAPKGVIHS